MPLYTCGGQMTTGSLLPSSQSQGPNSGFQAWWQVTLPAEPPLANDFAHWAISPALEVWGLLSVYCLGFVNSYFMDLVFSLRVLRQSRYIIKTILELISPGWPLADRNPLASASRALQWQVKSRHKTQLVLVFHPLYHTVSCSYYPMHIERMDWISERLHLFCFKSFLYCNSSCDSKSTWQEILNEQYWSV